MRDGDNGGSFQDRECGDVEGQGRVFKAELRGIDFASIDIP